MLKKFGNFLMSSIWDTGRVEFRQYSGLSGSRPEKLLILGFESSTFTYISLLKKFGHFLMNSSRDTGGGFRSPPPARGKDILIPHRIGLKNDNFTIEYGKFSRVFLETPLKYRHSWYGVYCVSSLYINYLWLIQLKRCVCGYANLPLHCYPNIFVTLTRLNCPVTHII